MGGYWHFEQKSIDYGVVLASSKMNEIMSKFKFSGHQTFAFRYGWLEKGVKSAVEYPGIFSADDAIVQLGVGKNMVESIRHWCLATQMLDEKPDLATNKGRVLHPSNLAKRLLLKEKWDPFFENDASLWLVHWLLVSNPKIGTSWQLAFGYFHRPDFSKRELVDFVKAYADKNSVRVNESSLNRDIDCLLRTYLPVRTGARSEIAEETFDCPLQELGLIQASPDGDFFRFAIGPKPSLPAQVFAFALDEFFNRTKSERKTLSVQECLYGAQSPGQAFKLDENSLVEYVEAIEEITDGAITLDETAGLKQIYRRQKLDPLLLLHNYYRSNS
jgi:hypothetical protein